MDSILHLAVAQWMHHYPSPLTGMLIAFGVTPLVGLAQKQGALRPAVVNYVFAERLHQEPDKVAAIALVGNRIPVITLLIALPITL